MAHVRSRRLRRGTVLLTASALAAAVVLAGCAAPAPEPESADDSAYVVPDEYKRLTLSAGSQGGILYNIAVAMSQVFNKELGMETSVQTNSTQANALEMEAGNLQLAFQSAADLVQVNDGDLAAPANAVLTRTLWNVNSSSFHVLVAGNVGIDSLEDFPGHTFATGVTGSIESEMFKTMLTCADVDVDSVNIQNISKDESAAAFKEGSIDGWTGLGGRPTAAYSDAFESNREPKLLSLPDDVVDCIIDEYVYLEKSVIPADTYEGQTEDVDTFNQWYYATVSADLPDDLVYNLAKVLDEHYDELVAALPAAADASADNTADFVAYPIHDGALEYLEDAGYTVASK